MNCSPSVQFYTLVLYINTHFICNGELTKPPKVNFACRSQTQVRSIPYLPLGVDNCIGKCLNCITMSSLPHFVGTKVISMIMSLSYWISDAQI